MTFVREHGVRLVPLDTLLREADIGTLRLPASAPTARFVNRDRRALMKPGAFLVTAGRGALVDEAALYDAPASGRLAGAGLDTFAEEPPWKSRARRMNV
jgi:phosphoglycerate dehydrogenase-like enzyme